MTTILTKKKDTTGAPAPGDLTNSAGGAELAVNTFDKRLYTKDAGGNVVEIGTNPSTIDTTTVDTTNLEVTNIKAKDGTAAATIANSTGKITVSTELAVDNINLSGNTISSTDTNGNIILAPNGTGQLVVNSGTVGAPTISPTGDLNTGVFFPAADTIAFGEGGTEVMRIDSAGSVGVGTNNPSAFAKFVVVQTSGSNAFQVATTTNGAGVYILPNNAGTTFQQSYGSIYAIATSDAQPLTLGTNATERMRIDSSGNVGIGSTVPSSFGRLVVSSSAASNSTITDLALQANRSYSTSNNGLAIVASASNGTLGTHDFGAITFNEAPTSNGGSAFVNMYAGGSSSAFNDASRFLRASSPSGTGIDNVAFWTGSAERMRITSAGDVFVGGTSGAVLGYEKFSAYGTCSFKTSGATALGLWNTANAGLITFYTDVGTLGGSISSIGGALTINAGNNLNFNAAGASIVTFNTNSAERVRITSVGRVGIGTVDPAVQFQVSATTEWGVTLRSASDTNTFRCLYLTQRARGSLASPTVPTSGTIIGGLEAGGWNSSAYTFGFNGGAAIQIAAEGTWTTTSCPTNIQFYTNPTGTAGYAERMRITSTGELLIGNTTGLGAKLVIYGTSGGTNNYIQITNPGYGTGTVGVLNTSPNFKIYNSYTSGTLATGAGIDIATSGYVGIGITTNTDHPLLVASGTSDYAISNECSHPTNPGGVEVRYTAAAPNNSGAFFFVASDTGATRAQIRSNGGLANYSGNDVNLSDAREKTNVELAGSYLDKVCAIPVKTFNYIDQNFDEDAGLTLGVIAQEVQAVAPELVTESNWGTEDSPKMRFSIYQTDLQYALMKSIQELKAELDSVKAELQTLKGN